MMALTLLASGVNYASNLIFSRVLTPAGYGDFTALIALTVIVAVPSGAAQTIVADRLAAYGAAGDRQTIAYLIRHAAAHVLVYATVLGTLYLAAIPLINSVMDLQSRAPLSHWHRCSCSPSSPPSPSGSCRASSATPPSAS